MAELSAYELQRLENIARNEAKLRALGLDKPNIPKAPPRPKSKKRARSDAPRVGERRSSRERSAPASYTPKHDDDDDDDYDDADDDDEDESEFEDDDSIPLPRRIVAAKKAKSPATVPTVVPTAAVAASGAASFLTVENAKTGRSTCRACRAPIAQGAPRAGMTAWIVGRQAMTWQCPGCLVGGLVGAVEATGRGKCKATGATFAKGAPKVGVVIHKATAWLTLEAAPATLAPVLAALGSREGASAALAAAAGLDALGADGAAALRRACLAAAAAALAPTEGGAADEARPHEENTPEHGEAPSAVEQPAAGAKTGAKGRVGWRFGGSVCFGSLLPAQETKSHCYARTHKGNTKTLAKGKDYWWMIVG